MKTPTKITKIDLYKLHKQDYVAPKKPVCVNIEDAVYLGIAGQGEPGGEMFSDKIGALYAMAFTIKMTRKFAGEQDYAVCKLEAQWWGGTGDGSFAALPKDQWCWKLLIRTPDIIEKKDLVRAATLLLKRGRTPAVQEVQLETLREGHCVQMLHVGPYDREPETVALMKVFAEKGGMRFHGRHHEIYLSDPRRVPPERLKTILRLPVMKA